MPVISSNRSRSFNFQHPLVVGLSLGIIVCIGVFFRFYGLGVSPLSVDEYYLTKSVTNILQKGIPEFAAGGGYYTRGLLQQYLAALLMLMGTPMEWAIRLLPAVSGLATIAACYYLARYIGGRRLAWMSVVLVSLSLWQIEFSRFGRMYAPFQAVFLWYLYFLTRAIDLNRLKDLWAAYAFAATGILLHTEALFILAFNFIPIFLMQKRNFLTQWITPGLFVISYFFYHSMSEWDVAPKIPPNLTDNSIAPSEIGALLPQLLLKQVMQSTAALTLYCLLVAVTIVGLWKNLRSTHRFELWSLLITASLILITLNQLGLAVICFVTALILSSSPKQPQIEPVKLQLYLTILFSFSVFWVWFGFSHDSWYGEISNIDIKAHSAKWMQLTGILLNYPDIITRFLKPLFAPIPITTTLLILSMLFTASLCVLRPRDYNDSCRIVLLVLIGSILLVSMISTDQKISRYSYFIYPVFLIFLCLCIEKIASLLKTNQMITASSLAMVLGFMVISEDFNFYHLSHITQPNIMYRTQYNLDEQNHYYPRRDFRTPATFINSRVKSNELIVSEVSPVDLYLQRPIDIIYLPIEQKRFWTRAALLATKDRWTDADLIYRREDLRQLLNQNSQPIWLIVFSMNWFNTPVKAFRNQPSLSLEYSNIDNTIDVFHVPAMSSVSELDPVRNDPTQSDAP